MEELKDYERQYIKCIEESFVVGVKQFAFWLLKALLIFSVVYLVLASCRVGRVNVSPEVTYHRRLANNDGEGISLGVVFSPSRDQGESPHRPAERIVDPIVCSVCLAAAVESKPEVEKPDENQDITIETPIGHFTIAGGSGALLMLLVLLGLQKKGILPTPTPKE